jgi:hypothetical protein
MLRSFVQCALVLSAVVAAPCLAADDPQLATPKLAAFAFVRAMEQNDMTQFRAVTIGSDDDYKLFEPLLGMVGSAKQLERAAREKFGKAGRVIVRDSPAVELEVHVQESDVKVTNDTAILRHHGQEDADPLHLRHTPAGWKVDLTAIPNRAQMSASAESMARMRKALADSAADIRAGKFSTPEAAEKVVLKRMKAATADAAAAGK